MFKYCTSHRRRNPSQLFYLQEGRPRQPHKDCLFRTKIYKGDVLPQFI